MSSTATARPVAADDLAVLRRWAQASSIHAALAQRAQLLLLLAADGVSNTAIADRLGVSRPTVIGWRRRYAGEGLVGLTDRPRPGRPQTVRRDRRAEILATTLTPPPEHLGMALEVATGRVTDQCYPRHRHAEFLAFLKLAARTYPRRKLHVVVDNKATHKHPKVQAWLARNPRIQLHVTPTDASWPNLIEALFAITTRQALRGRDFSSVAELVAAIGRFVDAWNQRCQPIRWVKDADQILAGLRWQPFSGTDRQQRHRHGTATPG